MKPLPYWRGILRASLLVVLLLGIAFGVLVVNFDLPIPRANPDGGPDGWHDYAGVIHIHSNLSSDAWATASDLVKTALRTDVKFMIVTDHGTLIGLEAKREGYYRGVLLLYGTELSAESGHLLVIDPKKWHGGAEDERIKLYQKKKSLLIAAHPFSPSKPWTRWEHGLLSGLEVINSSSWIREASILRWIRAGAIYPLNHSLAMLQFAVRPEKALAAWDRQLANGPFIGIAGANAHGTIQFGERIRIQRSYDSAFEFVQTSVLTKKQLSGELHVDRRIVHDALKAGHCFVAVSALSDPSGFRFTYRRGRRTAIMGDAERWDPSGRLYVRTPRPEGTVTITLYRDGEPILVLKGDRLEFEPPGPGVYRVEVTLRSGLFGPYPWIYSNAIRLR